MSESLLARMIGCDMASQIQSTLETFFMAQTKAKSYQYTTQLKNTRKFSFSMFDYLLCIKVAVDQLTSIGHVLSTSNHLNAIYDGLSFEYDTFVILVSSCLDSYFVCEIES